MPLPSSCVGHIRSQDAVGADQVWLQNVARAVRAPACGTNCEPEHTVPLTREPSFTEILPDPTELLHNKDVKIIGIER